MFPSACHRWRQNGMYDVRPASCCRNKKYFSDRSGSPSRPHFLSAKVKSSTAARTNSKSNCYLPLFAAVRRRTPSVRSWSYFRPHGLEWTGPKCLQMLARLNRLQRIRSRRQQWRVELRIRQTFIGVHVRTGHPTPVSDRSVLVHFA